MDDVPRYSQVPYAPTRFQDTRRRGLGWTVLIWYKNRIWSSADFQADEVIGKKMWEMPGCNAPATQMVTGALHPRGIRFFRNLAVTELVPIGCNSHRWNCAGLSVWVETASLAAFVPTRLTGHYSEII